MSVNKDRRLELIVQMVEEAGKITVNELATILKVTPETIRRDLDELQACQRITRIHGAAIPYVEQEVEMIFEKKLNKNIEKKRQICQKALEYIQDSDVIAVDVGTTTVHLPDYINGVKNLTVITNSIAAAQSFNKAIEEERMTGQVIVLPGYTNPAQASIKGAYTVDFLKKFHIDKAFLSCGGLTNQAVFDYDFDESMVSLTMLQNSSQSFLLVDSSKINQRKMIEISPIDSMDYIICDSPMPNNWNKIKATWISTNAH